MATDKRIKWCIENIPSFAEMYYKTQKIREEERKNRETFNGKAASRVSREVRRS